MVVDGESNRANGPAVKSLLPGRRIQYERAIFGDSLAVTLEFASNCFYDDVPSGEKIQPLPYVDKALVLLP